MTRQYHNGETDIRSIQSCDWTFPGPAKKHCSLTWITRTKLPSTCAKPIQNKVTDFTLRCDKTHLWKTCQAFDDNIRHDGIVFWRFRVFLNKSFHGPSSGPDDSDGDIDILRGSIRREEYDRMILIRV